MHCALMRETHCVTKHVGHSVFEEVCVCDHRAGHRGVHLVRERNACVHADRMGCAELCYERVGMEGLRNRRDKKVF